MKCVLVSIMDRLENWDADRRTVGLGKVSLPHRVRDVAICLHHHDELMSLDDRMLLAVRAAAKWLLDSMDCDTQSDILIERDLKNPVLYVMQATSERGKAMLVPAGDTGTIPYAWKKLSPA